MTKSIHINFDKLLMPALFGLISTLLKGVFLFFLSSLFSPEVSSYDLLTNVFWIEVGYNLLIAPVLFLILRPFDKLLFRMVIY